MGISASHFATCGLDARKGGQTVFKPYQSDAEIVERPRTWDKLKFSAAPGKKNVVIVSCGSFSPPTMFHLRMLEDARSGLLQQGYHVAGGFLSPVHEGYGKKSLVPMHHRVNMVGLALQDSDWLDVDTWECAQKAYTYTAPCLKEHFQEELKKLHPEARIMMVCGADLLESFTQKYPDGKPIWSDEDQEIILGECGICCMAREGTDLDKVISGNALLRKHKENIAIFKPSVQNNISSTLVRKLLQAQESIKYLVHTEVVEYIEEHQLASLEPWK